MLTKIYFPFTNTDLLNYESDINLTTDAYDSMISDRAYRNGLTSEEAVKIIEQGAGNQFDPNLVQIFLNILPDAQQEIAEYEKRIAAEKRR